MKAAGIVCEYNPFHLGHLYHLKKTREGAGEDEVIVCALSGDFVQRGEPSIISKFARAEAAVRCGADLVVELPSVWALQSAEGYAEAAVNILARMRISRLAFGAETDDYIALEDAARILSSESFENALAAAVKERSGIPYAAVREELLRDICGEKADLLKSPNNILALEYMKAAFRNAYDMSFSPVQRTGAGHDEVSEEKIRSASDVREMLLKGGDVSAFVPEASYEVIRSETEKGKTPVSLGSIEQALVSRLRGMGREDFLKVKDCDEELAGRISDAVYAHYALNDIFLAAKTKKYAFSRVRRVCVCAALGITADMQACEPPYIRILAAGQKGQAYLRELKKKSPDIPLATKAADIPKLGEDCAAAINMDSAIHDIYVLGYKDAEKMVCGEDFRSSPFML